MTKIKKERVQIRTEIEPVPTGIVSHLLFEADGGYKRRWKSWERRLVELAEYYEIPDDQHRWLLLSFKLAVEHVPGFREAPKRGRPKSWTTAAQSLLVIEMEESVDGGKTLQDAAIYLANQPHWKAFLSRSLDRGFLGLAGDPAEVLRQRYSTIKETKIAIETRQFYASEVADGIGDRLRNLYRSSLMKDGMK